MDDPSAPGDLAFAAAGAPRSVTGPSGYSERHELLGIERHQVEVFTFGEYRYSKLEDAVAQATRTSK
jgi:hypothetical protein